MQKRPSRQHFATGTHRHVRESATYPLSLLHHPPRCPSDAADTPAMPPDQQSGTTVEEGRHAETPREAAQERMLSKQSSSRSRLSRGSSGVGENAADVCVGSSLSVSVTRSKSDSPPKQRSPFVEPHASFHRALSLHAVAAGKKTPPHPVCDRGSLSSIQAEGDDEHADNVSSLFTPPPNALVFYGRSESHSTILQRE